MKTKKFGILLAIAILTVRTALSQSPLPILKIGPAGASQMSVTITNNIGTNIFDLEWTPVLASSDFPWTFAALGVPGGTNFLLNKDTYPAAFYRVILDNGVVPLWENASPNNPGTNLLKITIASPANGSSLN